MSTSYIAYPPKGVPIYATTGDLPTTATPGSLASVVANDSVYIYDAISGWILLAAGGSTLSGSGAATQLAVFTGAETLASFANLTLSGSLLSTPNISVTGTIGLRGATSGVLTQQAAAVTTPYTITWPAAQGASSTVLTNNGSGILSWATGGSGDVSGPASSILGNVPTFADTTGKLLQDSVIVNINSFGIGIGTVSDGPEIDVSSSENGVMARFTSSDTVYGSQFALNAGPGGGREYILVSTPSAGPIGTNKFAIYDAGASLYRIALDSSGNFGIGTTAPVSLLSVGASSQFQANSSGDLISIKSVAYSWPGSQGAASTVLTNDGAGNLSWSAGGGSGVVVITNGGTISGTYTGDVFVTGTAIFGADVTVIGDLIVENSLVNTDGFALTVRGDCIIEGGINFTPISSATIQGSVNISGDFLFGPLTLVADAMAASGDGTDVTLQSSTPLSSLGIVAGNVSVTFTSGANTGFTTPGPVSYDGSLTITFVTGGPGGHNYYPPNPVNNGDTFTVTQAGISSFRVNQGQSPSLIVNGDLLLNSAFLASGIDGSGAGGGNGLNITVGNDLDGPTTLTMDGGLGDSSVGGGTGGSLNVGGSVSQVNITSGGGLGYQAGTMGGAGGAITIQGNYVGAGLQVNGGNSHNGGSEPGGDGGQAGVVVTHGDCICVGSLTANGGDSGMAAGSGGGLGGLIQVTGDLLLGSGSTGPLANGGNIGPGGRTINTGSSAISGGQGGQILIQGNYTSTQPSGGITVNGGDSFNNQSANTITVSGGAGGTVQVNGDASFTGAIAAQGGDSTIPFSVGNMSLLGGAGGSINLSGTTTAIVTGLISVNGGAVAAGATAASGGNAGNMVFNGPATAILITANGQNGATTNAGAAGIVQFLAGATIKTVETTDGVGGTVPTSSGGVQLYGTCDFKTISVTNRSQLKIKTRGTDLPITLKVSVLSGKQVLTNNAGSDTANINTQIANALWTYDPTADAWYKLSPVVETNAIGGGTLSGGTVTITTSAAKTTSRIFLQDTTTGSLVNVGTLTISAKNSGNFVVNSTNILDTSTFDWYIINP